VQKLKWKYNKTRKRWVAEYEKSRLVITKMDDEGSPYRLSIQNEGENLEDAYMNYVWDFMKFKSAKQVGWFIIYG